MLLTQTEMIYARGVKDLLCNPRYELPGGSSFKPNVDVYQTAADELFEETGIRVEKSRLRKEMSRQAAATVTTLVKLW